MNALRDLFPFSFKACSFKEFLITLIVYIVLDCICNFVIGILVKLPLIGGIFGLIGWVLSAYFIIGMVIAILVFLNIIK